MEDIRDYLDLHLDELPFGEMPSKEDSAEDLLKLMAEQIGKLAKIILWIRCTNDGHLTDINYKNIRSLSVTDLIGSFTTRQSYNDFVKYNCDGHDPLDLSDYISLLISVYNQRQILKQASR